MQTSTGAGRAVLERLFARIEDLRDELVALTQALVRIPTVNPPGELYEDCARFIGKWLAGNGFAVEYPRAVGEKEDSDRYPRTNVVARLEGQRGGPCVHFNSHMDVVEPGRS